LIKTEKKEGHKEAVIYLAKEDIGLILSLYTQDGGIRSLRDVPGLQGD
jgi:hypothetical protein